MKIFSPTSTITFDTCPLMWLLKKSRLRPNIINRRTCAAAVGIGFAEGVNVYFSSKDATEAAERGEKAAMEFLDSLIDAGATVTGETEATFAMVGQRVYHSVIKFDRADIPLKNWKNIQSELVFPDHGHCRVDFVGESPEDGVTLIDFKTRVSKPSDWALNSQLAEAEQSWQLKHYVWACMENNIPIDAYGIMVVVFEPTFKVHQQLYVVDRAELQRWYEDAQSIWRDMEQWEEFYKDSPDTALRSVRRSTQHYNRWGKCDFFDACFSDLTFSDRYVTLTDKGE